MKKIIFLGVVTLFVNCYAQPAYFSYDDKNNGKSLLIVGQKNLAVSFRNGDPIKEAKTNEEWLEASRKEEPAFCYYNNDPQNGKMYGLIYNYYAFKDNRGLCANEWRKIMDTDVKILEGIIEKGGDSAKSALISREGWSNLKKGTNNSGLNLLPGGYRDEEGNFVGMGSVALIWMSSESNLYCPFWGIKDEKTTLFNNHGFFNNLRYHPGFIKEDPRTEDSRSFFDQNVKKMGFYVRAVCTEGDFDEDGVEDHKDKCLNLAGDISSMGCPDTDGDGVIDNMDACPNVSGNVCNGCPKIKEELLVVDGILFKKNSAVIQPNQIDRLAHMVQLLKTDTCLKIIIQGSSDYDGPMLKDERKGLVAKNITNKYAVSSMYCIARLHVVSEILTKAGISKYRIIELDMEDYRRRNKDSWKTQIDCVEFKLYY